MHHESANGFGQLLAAVGERGDVGTPDLFEESVVCFNGLCVVLLGFNVLVHRDRSVAVGYGVANVVQQTIHPRSVLCGSCTSKLKLKV